MDEKDVDQNFLSFEKMSSNDENYLTRFKFDIYIVIFEVKHRDAEQVETIIAIWYLSNDRCSYVLSTIMTSWIKRSFSSLMHSNNEWL